MMMTQHRTNREIGPTIDQLRLRDIGVAGTENRQAVLTKVRSCDVGVFIHYAAIRQAEQKFRPL